MARTTADNVGTVVKVKTGDDLTAAITTANELVTECCAGDAGPDTDYTANRLELIERYLAAHFYLVWRRQRKTEKAGPVAASYDAKLGLVFNNTTHGQSALALDTNGGLAALNKKTAKGAPRRVGITWLGTED